MKYMWSSQKIINNQEIELLCCLNKDWRAGNIKIERAGGQTNRNYIVEHQRKKFFVRLPWEVADVLDRKVEAKNVLLLAKCRKLAGILPKYYFYILKKKNILSPRSNERFDLPDGTQILEYIEGKDIDGRDLAKPKIQDALIKTLHLFHTSGVKFVNPYDVFEDEMARYKNKAKNYPISELIKKEQINKIEKIEKLMRKKLLKKGKVSTHNDLIFENLRLGKDGKVYLLDFEYAGFNIRDGLHYDLGIILGGNLFYKNPITFEIYNQILEKASKIYNKKIDPHKTYCGALTNILIMFWWGIVRYFNVKSREEKRYFKNYVLERAKRILKWQEG